MAMSSRFVNRYTIASAALVLTIVLSYVGARMTGRAVESEQVTQYERELNEAATRVEAKLLATEQALVATAGTGWSSRLEWREAAAKIRAAHAVPGLLGTVFVRLVTADERLRYETSVKGDHDVHPKGHPNFTIFPVGTRDQYFVVHDYEPWTGNLTAVGFDIATQNMVRPQLDWSRETGQPVAIDRSGEAGRTRGFFLAVPVYDRTLPAESPTERHQALLGFAVGVIDTAPLMEGALKGLRSPHLSLEVEEVGQTTAAFLAFDADSEHDARTSIGGRQDVREIKRWGRTWHLYSGMVPGQLAAVRRSVERRILVGGTAIGIILTLLLWYYIDGRDRALQRVAQVTRELRDSQERFAETFGPSAVGMAMLAEDGRFLQVNAAYCALLGYTEQELQGLTYAEVTHPDDRETSLQLTAKLRTGELPYIRSEKRFMHKNGQSVWCQVTVTRAYDSEGKVPYFIGQAEDLTAKRRAEEAARQQEELYRILAENTTDLVRLHSVGGRCVYVRPSCQTILGLSPDEYREADLLSLVHPRDLPAIQESLAVVMAGGCPRQTYQVRRTTGEYIWLETDLRPVLADDGALVQVLSCSRDVTDRKRAEEQVVRYADEIERRHQQLDLLVRSMSEGVIAIDESQRLLLMNLSASRLLGMSHVPPGPPIRSLRLPDPLLNAMALAAQGHSSDDRLVLRVGDVELSVSVAPVATSDGRIAGAVALLLDITAQSQMARLRENFVASASHELRGPLAALSAVVEAMRDGLIPVEAYPRYHDRALEEIHRLRRLTEDLLMLSQLKAGLAAVTPVEFDLRTLLQGMYDRWVHRCAASGITLVWDSPDELLVRADCDRVEQVLVAFLDNAVRHTPPGGKIRLFAEQQDRDVRLGVQDTGTGIAPEHLPLIWERFYKVDQARTRKDGGGSGLGLSIVSEVAARMHGSVQATSQVGQGSVFSLSLPDVALSEVRVRG